MPTSNRFGRALMLSTILIPLAPVAVAQDAGDADTQRVEDTVIVTGSKRDTELIQSDLAVTVFDESAIEDARLRDFRRIDDLVPNVQFNEMGQRGSIYITVRGVESNPFIINRAAVYIDGIPFRELSNSVLNQIESIEVLRGPQGTLYGANTESGLILVKSKAPSDILEANMRLTAKGFASGSGYELDGAISGPLIEDQLAGSIAFNLATEDAFIKNYGTSTGETGEINESFIQGRLRWTPNSDLTVNATAYWLDMDAPGLFDQQYVPTNLDQYNSLYSDFFNFGNRAEKWTAYEDAPKYTTEEEFVIGVSANYNLAAGALDVALSHRSLEENAKGLDFDLTASPIVAGQELESSEYSSAEIRYSSPESDVFDYIIGGSYYEDFEENTKATFLGPGDLNSYNRAPVQRQDSEDISLFGSFNWYVTDKLRLGGGLRFDRAKRSTLQREGILDLGFGSVVSYRNAELSRTFEEWLPRDFSLYASAARGYIPGGFNLVAVQDGITDDNILNYESETLWSREIGYKWRSADRRLSSSGAVFYITSDNWQEVQIATDASGRPVSSDYTGSDASIRSQGVEFEIGWEPIDQLNFNAHLGLIDAEYEDLQLTDTLNVKGQRIQFVPEYDASIATRYEWANGWFIRGEVSFTGETSLRARGDAVQPASEIFGLQIGYEADYWSIQLFGENLTDERRSSGLAIENLAFGSDGLYYSPLDAPRVIGLELEARY